MEHPPSRIRAHRSRTRTRPALSGLAPAGLALALLLTLLCPIRAAAQEARGSEVLDLEAGRQYPPGTRLRAPALGILWTLPPEWLGGVAEDARTFLLGSDTHAGTGAIFLLTGTNPQAVAEAMGQTQDLGDGVTLEPLGEPEVSGPRLTQAYASGENAGRAVAVVSPSGQGVVYLFVGPAGEAPHYAGLLERLAASTEFVEPETAGIVAQWNDLLAGMMLKQLSSYASGTSGGYNIDRVWHLCRDGRFAYANASAVSADVPGMSGSGVTQDSFTGTWRVETVGAQVVLVLAAEDGSVQRLNLEYGEEKTFLDGERVFRVPSDRCR